MKHPDTGINALLTGLASTKLATIDLSLDRVTALLAALGNPQDRLPPVVHVAGTNGKGSLVAYLTAICEAAGLRVHRFTSPHLVRFNEQILLAGKEIDDETLRGLLARVAEAAQKHPVTFFEATTAAAFLAFAENPADIVLLETGLGGRLDATNMVRSPALTAITPISIDHREFLGDTITDIAAEKAGILKRGVHCVTGPQVGEASQVIERKAAELDAPLHRFGKEWQAHIAGDGFHYRSAQRNADFSAPNLAGVHQIFNAATAIACAECLEGFAISDDHIRHGITHADWPARLQQLTHGHLVALLGANSEFWVDGGHNPSAGVMLAEWVKMQKKPVHLICGMLKNKDAEQFLAPLADHIKSVTAVSIPDRPDSQQPQVISVMAEALRVRSSAQSEVRKAIEHIVEKEGNGLIILVCGSLYLAGNILWQNSKRG